jgi:hypothetical protein
MARAYATGGKGNYTAGENYLPATIELPQIDAGCCACAAQPVECMTITAIIEATGWQCAASLQSKGRRPTTAGHAALLGGRNRRDLIWQRSADAAVDRTVGAMARAARALATI